MWAEAAILAYLGLACLARGNHRFHALPLPGDRIVPPGVARTLGTALLVAAVAAAVARLGIAQGLVAFALVVAVAGIALVLMLSVRPRGALAPTVPLLLAVSTRRHPDRT